MKVKFGNLYGRICEEGKKAMGVARAVNAEVVGTTKLLILQVGIVVSMKSDKIFVLQ